MMFGLLASEPIFTFVMILNLKKFADFFFFKKDSFFLRKFFLQHIFRTFFVQNTSHYYFIVCVYNHLCVQSSVCAIDIMICVYNNTTLL
jgi:hypothetical protein